MLRLRSMGVAAVVLIIVASAAGRAYADQLRLTDAVERAIEPPCGRCCSSAAT